MRKVLLHETDKREVSQWLPPKLVESSPPLILKGVFNDPF